MNDLVIELTGYKATPRFEFDVNKSLVEKDVHSNTALATVPLFGKPDCFFMNFQSARVILDWKVNGYCSKASPAPGYVRCRGLDGHNTGAHKSVMLINFKGIDVAIGGTFKKEWEDQLIIYTWLLGDGTVSFDPNEWIVGIEQLACNSPKLRVASFRLTRSKTAAEALWARLVRMWNAVQRGHYFLDLSPEESDERVAMYADADQGGGDLAWLLRGI